MDDVFSCGETAWDLIHDRSYSLLRKKYTPSLKGNPERCYIYFFICGISSTGVWFAFISSLLFDSSNNKINFLYYISAYTLGSLPVLALHKNYEKNISKRDFPKWTFMFRMSLFIIYGIVISIIMSFYSFSLVANLLCILALGISHGALLGGLSQLASVFPSSCTGALLLGVDLAGLIPLLLISIVAITGTTSFTGHVIFIVPGSISFMGILSLFLLIRSEMANLYLGQSNILRNNIEGLENLLSRSGDDNNNNDEEDNNNNINNNNNNIHESPSHHSLSYVSLSSFIATSSKSSMADYKPALAWGVVVFVCTFCTYFMIPFFPETSKIRAAHFPVFLFFTQHFADIVGRELLCGFIKNAIKGKAFMWMLVVLRALIIMGWLAEVLISSSGGFLAGTLEVLALLLCGLVGGAINPSVYMLAGLKISDDSRDSVKAIHCCMWCSVGGAIVALIFLNSLAFIHPSLSWG